MSDVKNQVDKEVMDRVMQIILSDISIEEKATALYVEAQSLPYEVTAATKTRVYTYADKWKELENRKGKA